jgi:histone H1/5
MTTKTQDKKTRTGKAPAKKAPAKKARVSKAGSKQKESIGLLAATQKMHISVIEIPLTFMTDLGIAPDKVKSARKLNKKFVGGMYENFDDMATKISDTVSAPAKLIGTLIDKLQEASDAKGPKAKPAKSKPKAKVAAKPKAAAKPKVASKPKVTAKPKAKVAAKPKAATKVKAKVAPKPKAPAKPKAVRKTKVKAATLKPKTVSNAATGQKPTKKAIVAAPSGRSNLNTDVRLRSV